MLQYKCELQSKQAVGRASGSAGGSDADPEHAAPATASPASKARRNANKRRATTGDVADADAYGHDAPSEGGPGKRHRAAAAGARGGDAAVVARAALGAAEAEARCAGEVVIEDNDEGRARAALRRLDMRAADPRYAAALAHERADLAKQARSLGLCAMLGCSAAACSRTVHCKANRERASCTLPRMWSAWVMSW